MRRRVVGNPMRAAATGQGQANVSNEKYTNVAQQRVLRTLRLLTESAVNGTFPSRIATRLRTLPSNTTRDLANLRQAGFAVQMHGRWFPIVPAR
jgi:hypothetical protein